MLLIEGFLAAIVGGVAFLVVNFWMQPLLRYKDVKHQVISDLVFYANAINVDGMNQEMQDRRWDRCRQNRLHAAELKACSYALPSWYRWWLIRRGESAEKASEMLIGLSNSNDFDIAHKFAENLRSALRLPVE